MSDDTAAIVAAGYDAPFTGQFELRGWLPPRWPTANDGVPAHRVANALMSCRSGLLVLLADGLQQIVMDDGKSQLLVPVEGELVLDRRALPYFAYFRPDEPGHAAGALEVPGNGGRLELNLLRRQHRIQAYLFGARPDDGASELLQVFQFVWVGTTKRVRRARPVPAAEAAAPKPSLAPPARPSPELAEQWATKLRHTRLSHAGSGVGSNDIEQIVVLHLSDSEFVLDRSTSTRLSAAGMAWSTPRYSQLRGTWSVFGASDSRAWLELATTQGERMTYCLSVGDNNQLLVDGAAWKWVGE